MIPPIPPEQLEVNIHNALKIPGMMGAQELAWLGVKARRYQKIVEVGSWCGRSTCALCDNCSGRVFAVDTWEGSEELLPELHFMRSYLKDPDWPYTEFVSHLGDRKNLCIIRMPSLHAAQQFQSGALDMVFLDGAHDYDSVRSDIAAWWPKIHRGGLLAGHDLKHPPLKAALGDLFSSFREMDIPQDANIWAVEKSDKAATA